MIHKRIHIILLIVAALWFENGFAQNIALQCNQPSGCAPHGVIITATDTLGVPLTSVNWAITGPSGNLIQSNANPYVAIYNSPGAYDFTLILPSGVSRTFNDFVEVYAQPIPAMLVDQTAGCLPFCTQFQDASVSVSGPIIEWSWDFGDGTFNDTANPMHCYAQAGAFTPVLTVVNAYGCFATIQMPQLINVSDQLPVASFDIGGQSSCSLPTTISFNSTSVYSSNYLWFVNDNAAGSATESLTLPFQQTGIYDVCLIASNNIGCSDTVCQSFEVSEQPTAGFIMENDTICAGQSVVFQNTTYPLPTSVEWDFNNDGVTNSTSLNGSNTFNNPGNYIVHMTAHFGAVCEMTFSDTVSVMANPSVNFSADITSACYAPLTVNFTNLATNQPNSVFSWFINGEWVSDFTHLTYTFDTPGYYDVKLLRENSFGCLRSRTHFDIIQIETPTLTFEHEEAICVGESAEISNVEVSSGEAITDYSWDMNADGIEDADGATPDYTFEQHGEYSIVLTVTTANGCLASDTSDIPLSVLQPIVPSFTVNHTESCAGQDFQYCIGYQPGNTYIWDFHDGSGAITMEETDSCLTHTYEDTGYFDVSLTIYNGACNTGITMEDFVHIIPPLALFSFDVTCDSFGVEFTDESIGADSLVWDFGDGSPLLINEQNPTHYYADPGQYTVTLTAFQHGFWCSDSKRQTLFVSRPNPKITLTPQEGCSPLHVAIENEKRNIHWEVQAENGDEITVERVYIPGEPAWTIVHHHAGTTTTTHSDDPINFTWPQLIFDTPGVYDIYVSATNFNGCVADTVYSDAITVLQGGHFSDVSHSILDACNNGSVLVQFEATSPQANQCVWTFSDGAQAEGHSVIHEFSGPFDYTAGIGASLTATNADGCSSSSSQNVDVALPPLASFDWADPAVCRFEQVEFNNTSSAPIGTSYAWSFGDDSVELGITDASHTYSANGEYTVCLTATNILGCSSSFCHPVPVVVESPDALMNIHPEVNNCLYSVSFENLTQGPISATWWDFGDNQTGNETSVAHTYPIGVFDATMITTASNGCTDTLIAPDILNFSESVGPFRQFLDSVQCTPFQVSFEAFNINDASFGYFWDFNDGEGDPFGGTVTQHTYNTPGTYCPSIIMTDANGCDVYIHCSEPIVVVNLVASYVTPEYICAGDTATLYAGNVDGIIWADAGTITDAGTLEITGTSSMDVTLTAGLSDCVTTDTLHIEVKTLPEVTLQLTDSVCFDSGELTLSGGLPAGAAGAYFFGETSISTFNTQTAPNTHYSISYVFTDEFGCSNSATDIIYVMPLPIVEPITDRAFCDGDTLYEFPVDTSADMYYTVNGTQISAFQPLYNSSPYSVVLHYTDAHGCYNSSGALYTVWSLPVVTILPDTFCTGRQVELRADATVAEGSIASAHWNIDGIYAGSDLNLNIPDFGVGGDHPVALSVTTDRGCSLTDTTTIRIYDSPIADFRWENACEKDSMRLYDESVLGNDSLVTWLWTAGDNSWIGASEESVVFDNHGAVSLALTVVTDHGCSASSQQQAQIRPMPMVDLEASSHCLGEQTLFTAALDVAYGGYASGVWSIEGFPFAPVGESTSFVFDSAGTYTYSFEVTSNFGCTRLSTDSVVVYPLPLATLLFDDLVVCTGQAPIASCQATVDAPSIIQGYRWTLDGEEVGTANPAVIELMDIGAYNLDLTVTTNHGCVAFISSEEPIVVYPSPDAGFSWSVDQSTESPAIQVVAETSPDVTLIGYNWGDGSNSEPGDNHHVYAEDGTYEITQVVTNSFGCTAMASQTIQAYNGYQFFIPSAFTPDQNNHNEVFLPVVTGSHITLYVFRVYDRWGIEVFTSKTIGEGWDGRYHDAPVQDGVYTWSVDMIVRGRSELISKKGSVLVLR